MCRKVVPNMSERRLTRRITRSVIFDVPDDAVHPESLAAAVQEVAAALLHSFVEKTSPFKGEEIVR